MSRIDDALRDFLSLDVLATRATTLLRIDPRAKILATAGFILLVVSFDRYAVAPLLPLAAFPVLMAALGDIPARLILRKLMIAAPFALTVGLFNPLLDRTPLLEMFGYPIAAGWVSFASIMLRFCLTVSAALILVAGTGFHQVCIGLRMLRVPQVFTTQLLFLHRYAVVLAGEAARMSLARELRAAPGQGLPLPAYASLLGHLLLRALDRAQRIHFAMLSRGFSGELSAARPLHWRSADTLFLAGCSAGLIIARCIDLAHLLGNLVLMRMG